MNCTELGTLVLYDDQSGDPIEDLSCLSCIEEVRAEIEIQDIAAREISFPNLVSVGNFDMHSISAEKIILPALKTVSGRFRVGNDDSGTMPTAHESLKSINLESLNSIGRSFVLFLCENLESLETPDLRYVGEDIKITGGKIESLDFMKNITELYGSLNINANLMTLDGFSVRYIETGLSLSIPGVMSLEPLSVLESVPYINLKEGYELTSFKGLEHLNPTAIDLEGFPKITTLQYLPISDNMEHVQINSFDVLEDLLAFQGVTGIGDLYLINCPALTGIEEIANLSSVGNMSIVMLEGVTALPEFANLKKVDYSLEISKMSKLTDISGLGNITEVGSLQIDNLLILPELTGFENLRKISGGSLLIGNLPFITDLDVFGNLEEVVMPAQSDVINITMNSNLVSYSGLAEILIKYWYGDGGKFPKVSITGNKYNPTYEQLVNGEYEMKE